MGRIWHATSFHGKIVINSSNYLLLITINIIEFTSIYGFVTTHAVPGPRDGAGTLSWEVYDEAPGPEDLRSATLTFGQAHRDREELTLIFDLDIPVTGSYTFGVTAKDMLSVTREIVIP